MSFTVMMRSAFVLQFSSINCILYKLTKGIALVGMKKGIRLSKLWPFHQIMQLRKYRPIFQVCRTMRFNRKLLSHRDEQLLAEDKSPDLLFSKHGAWCNNWTTSREHEVQIFSVEKKMSKNFIPADMKFFETAQKIISVKKIPWKKWEKNWWPVHAIGPRNDLSPEPVLISMTKVEHPPIGG